MKLKHLLAANQEKGWKWSKMGLWLVCYNISGKVTM